MNHKGTVSNISGKKGPLSFVKIIEIYKAQLTETVLISFMSNFHHSFLSTTFLQKHYDAKENSVWSGFLSAHTRSALIENHLSDSVRVQN